MIHRRWAKTALAAAATLTMFGTLIPTLAYASNSTSSNTSTNAAKGAPTNAIASSQDTAPNAVAQNGQIPGVAMPVAPETMAKSILVMDADNGQILYAKNPDERRAPASTTKLMTMLLIAKAVREGKASWNEEVPVTLDAYKVAVEPGVSDAYLDPKEHFTLQDMMKFIAVISANDATIAAADKIGGDKQAFVNMMNQEAKHLGLTGTHYMNPDGLPSPDHYTTARDLAELARHIVTDYPEILSYTSLPKVTVRKGNTWTSTDELLGHFEGVDGLKTGFTDDAGYCYVGTAKQNSVRLITVVMGDTKTNIHQRFIDTAKLLNYGFHNFTEQKSVKAQQILANTVYLPEAAKQHLQVKAERDLIADLPNGMQGQVVMTPAAGIKAPVKAGQEVGQLAYQVHGQTVSSVPVVAVQDDSKASWFIGVIRRVHSWFGHLLHRA